MNNLNTSNTSSKSSKSQSAADKIKAISAKFDLADELISADVVATLDSEVQEVVKNKQDYNPIDVMSLETMSQDFSFSRETLKESIVYGRKVLEMATQDLLLAEGDKKSGNTIAFAELTTAVLNGVKTYSQLYKDFSTVLLNIKKINTSDTPDTVNNTVNIIEDISTVDLIERLKDADKDT
jgi:hypothetical protein